MDNKKEYIKTALKFWEYRNQDDFQQLKRDLAKLYYGDENQEYRVFLCNNGRSCEYLFLKAVGLKSGESVALQGFTCNAVVNPILWLDLEPLYIDIERSTLNMSISDLKAKLTPDTRVVIAQHTFGRKANIEGLLDLQAQFGFYILEDCAHILGVQSDSQMVGIEGDAALLSFGIEKSLSTRVGGALLVNNDKLLEKVESEYSQFEEMEFKEILLWLLNPLVWQILRRMGARQNRWARALNAIGLVNLGLYSSELRGVKPTKYPRRLAPVLASLVSSELKNVGKLNEHRASISQVYSKRLSGSEKVELLSTENELVPFLRYPVLLNSNLDRDMWLSTLNQEGYYVGKWYSPPIFPEKTDLDKMKYSISNNPIAFEVSSRIINLPTGEWVTSKRVDKIIERLV